MEPNQPHQFYEGDSVTFRGYFHANGVEQIPDAGTGLAEVWKLGDDTVFLASTSATISGNYIEKKLSSLEKGTYIIYLTASYNSGADTRTGAIEFIVREKKAS